MDWIFYDLMPFTFPILSMHFSLCHFRLQACLVVRCVLLLTGLMGSVVAQAIEVSNPVGQLDIGKNLVLKSRVSNLPAGTETQLRSTCLKSRFRALEATRWDRFDSQAGDVVVDFLPDLQGGGELVFRSRAAVNHALIELELVSNCPLLVFETRWPLILAPAGGESKTNPTDPEAGRPAKIFDLEGSALLAFSRQQPQLRQAEAGGRQFHPADLPRSESSAQSRTTQSATQPETAATLKPSVIHDTAVAAVTDEQSSNPAAEAGAAQQVTNAQAGFASIDESAHHGFPTDLLGLNQYAAFSLTGLALAGLLAVYARLLYVKRKVLDPQDESPILGVDQEWSATNHESTLFGGSAGQYLEGEQPWGNSLASPGGQRLLESFLGADTELEADCFKTQVSAYPQALIDVNHHASLLHSLELVHKSESREWLLPASFMNLVESRNKVLQAPASIEALQLRGHIALIELAFRDALQGRQTSQETAEGLVDQVFGTDVARSTWSPAWCVPDLIKSLVRAKMCEVTGTDQREILRQNLLFLETPALCPFLCFKLPEWREFLSEEGFTDLSPTVSRH